MIRGILKRWIERHVIADAPEPDYSILDLRDLIRPPFVFQPFVETRRRPRPLGRPRLRRTFRA